MEKIFIYLVLFTINYEIIFINCVNGLDKDMDKPAFRIVAPQVICLSKKDSDFELPTQTTISMQTKNGQQLKYRVEIFFQVFGDFRGQQYSLSLWNVVRRLESRINTKDIQEISLKNQININNTELVTGVNYIFKLIGADENGIESDPQNYTVTFSDGKIQRTQPDGTIIPDDISFLLLGAEVTYGDVEYIIEANVFFCEPKFTYYFKWEMTNLEKHQEKWLRIPGSVLRIPSGNLKGGQNYLITAFLVLTDKSSENISKKFLQQSINVRVLDRGFSVSVSPTSLSIGINRPIEFQLNVIDSDNTGSSPKIAWSCKSIVETENCDEFKPSSTLTQTIEFANRGDYIVNAAIKINDEEKSTISMITVDPQIIVHPILRNPPNSPILPEQGFQMETTIDNVIPNCYAIWTTLKNDEIDYEYFDIGLIPNGLGNITVLDLEGNFLSELVDYSNDTMSRNIMLTVPGKSDQWEGLKPNKKYKFRLNITCPAPITNLDDNPDTRENITSFIDVIVETNQPPIGQPLEISPLNGTALKTVFKFATALATDQETDYPLLYKFCYQIDEYLIDIGEYYENRVVNTILPYSDTEIQTRFLVCDSREACSTIMGPNITTNPILMTDTEFQLLINEIKSSMNRMEYDKSLGTAIMAGLSFQHMNDTEHFNEIEKTVKDTIQHEINRLLEIPTVQIYISIGDVVHFVGMARKTISVFREMDELTLQLLHLLETASTDEHFGDITSSLTPPIIYRRKRRSVKPAQSSSMKYLTTKNVRYDQTNINVALEVTKTLEHLINSSDPVISRTAKYNYTQKIHKLIEKACFDNKNRHIDNRYIKLEILTITMNDIQKHNFTIPMRMLSTSAQISFNKMLFQANLPHTDVCIGKIRYPSDYLTGTDETEANGEIFEVFVLKINKNDHTSTPIKLIDLSNQHNFDVKIPFYDALHISDIQCEIWINNTWNNSVCRKISVQVPYVNCKCNQLGYFRAVPSNNTIELTTIYNTDEIPTIISNTQSSQLVPEINDHDKVTTPTTLLTTIINNNNNNNQIDTTITAEINISTPPTEQVNQMLSTSMTKLSTLDMTTNSPATTEIQPNISNPIKITQFEATTAQTTSVNDITVEMTTTISSTISSMLINENENIANFTQKGSVSSSTGYVLAGVLIILGFFFICGVYTYNRRKMPNKLAQQLDVITSQVRNPMPGSIHYARFQDELTMRGDNVESNFNNRH